MQLARPRALAAGPRSLGALPMEPAGVDIKTLTAPQLQQLGEQLEGELNTLSESFQSLQAAVTRFFQSGTALEALAEEAEGTAMMVPLTDSLYAPGKLGCMDKVLLDIGTGYFVEVRGWRLPACAAQP